MKKVTLSCDICDVVIDLNADKPVVGIWRTGDRPRGGEGIALALVAIDDPRARKHICKPCLEQLGILAGRAPW